jgi:hypothetical protein
MALLSPKPSFTGSSATPAATPAQLYVDSVPPYRRCKRHPATAFGFSMKPEDPQKSTALSQKRRNCEKCPALKGKDPLCPEAKRFRVHVLMGHGLG